LFKGFPQGLVTLADVGTYMLLILEVKKIGKRSIIFFTIHIIDTLAYIQIHAVSVLAEPLIQYLDRFFKGTFLLIEQAETQVASVIWIAGKGFMKKFFGNRCPVGDGIYFRIIPMAEGHCEPGIKIGMQPVERRIVDEIDILDKRRQVLIKGMSDGFSVAKDIFCFYTGVNFKIKQIFYAVLPDFFRDTALVKELLI
jgi:hypothetical protein